MPALLDADFPHRLRALFDGPADTPTRVLATDYAPTRGGATYPVAPSDLQPWLALLIALLVPFINGSKDFEYWILCAVPFAAFHANVYFAPQKRWLPAILHWGTAAFILALNYYILTQ